MTDTELPRIPYDPFEDDRWPVHREYGLFPDEIIPRNEFDVVRVYDPLCTPEVLIDFARITPGDSVAALKFVSRSGTVNGQRLQEFWTELRALQTFLALRRATTDREASPADRREMVAEELEKRGYKASNAETVMTGLLSDGLSDRIRLRVDSSGEVRRSAQTLAAAIWFHVAEGVAGGKVLRECEECHNYFFGRRNQRFCSATGGRRNSRCEDRNRKRKAKEGGD